MATPSAVLSVLVSADTEKATAQLSKFNRQLQATSDVARKGIEARMDGRFNGEAFTKYEAALKRASTAAKDRAAFKAELGANFNNRAFNEYQRSVDKAAKSTDNAAKHTSGLSKSVGGLTKSLLAAGGAFAAYEAAKEAISSTVELGHATERLSAVTGLGVKQASTWIETMKVRGVQTKAVGMAFITLSRNVRTAQDADAAHITKIRDLVASQKVERTALEATGASHARLAALEDRQRLAMDKLSGPSTSKAVAAFAELGVSQDTLKSKNTEAILLAVADGMSKIVDPTRRAALAQQIFGRGAQGLIPILAQGRQGVDDALKATQRYGAFLPQNVKQLQGAVEAQHNLNLAMDGLKISFTEAVLPTLLKGADALVKFIGQMRSGSGAGGQFATTIKSAFGTIKDVITGVVTAVGGLGNAVKIALVAFAATKVYDFVEALKALKFVIATSPVGAFLTAVGLLASALIVLSGRQRSAAETARDVANAWNTARDAATALDQANLQVVQSKLNVVRTNEALTQAERDVTKAQDEHGKKSPQYKQAEQNLAQAKIDSKQASIDLTNATRNQTKAQGDSTTSTQKATAASKGQIATDKSAVQWQQHMIDTLTRMGFAQQTNTVGANALRDARKGLSTATEKLRDDTAALNTALNATPKVTLANIDLNVDFQSNMAGAIDAIAKSIGGHPLSSTPSFAKPQPGRPGAHYSGGLVTQPGYFAGEEAPRHPEVILATNPAYRQRNLGLFAQAGKMLGVPGFLSGGITPTTSQEVSGAPPWAQKTSSAWMKSQAASWVNQAAQTVAAAFAGAGGGGGRQGRGGLGTFDGLSVANWIIPELVYAQKHGWRGVITSGFRPGFDPHAPSGSEHALTSYPGGAVDFGGMVDPAGLANKLAFMAATTGYKGLRLIPAQGFRDDGHMSGTGHYQGGIHGRAIRALNRIPGFAQGGVNFQGKVSTFGPPNEAAGTTAYGRSSSDAGISLRIPGTAWSDPANRALMGHLFDVYIGSHHARLMDIDLGPNQFTGRSIDVTGAGSSVLGINPRAFPTDAIGRVAEVVAGAVTKAAGRAAAGVAKKAKKFVPSPVPKLSLPHNLANVPSGATPTITALLGKLNNIIDPNVGTASALQDRIDATSSIDDQLVGEYQAANPNTDASTGLIAFTDPATGATTHSIDQVFVNMRVAELNQLLTWQATLRNQLRDSLFRIADLLNKIAVQIATRRAYIDKLRKQITGNILVIDALQKWEKNPKAKLSRRDKSNIDAEIAALKLQDTQLGGNAMKIGSAGILGKVSGEIDSLNQTASTLVDNRTAIAGASGIGGTLGAASLQVQAFQDQLNVFSPSSTQAALAAATAADLASGVGAGGGDATGATAGPDPALLQQLLDQAHLATSVAEEQLSVLQATPPFGGSFAQGGIVPGPLGAPRTIIAHAGEAVGTPGDTHVHMHFASGMEWLKDFVNVRVDQNTRRDARNASRSLPSRKPRF